jgi:hypothetical protein
MPGRRCLYFNAGVIVGLKTRLDADQIELPPQHFQSRFAELKTPGKLQSLHRLWKLSIAKSAVCSRHAWTGIIVLHGYRSNNSSRQPWDG